ncbi:hypothetical protein Tco_1414870 [Tanacetum coccineum]
MTSSNPRNQATIQDGRVIVQNVQGGQTQGYASSGANVNANGIGVNRNMVNSVTNQTKDEEQLAFLVDPGDKVESGPDTQTLPTTAIFQTNELDAFDSDCDEAPSASVVLMAKLSAYDLDVLSEYSEQPIFVDDTNIEITCDNNVISYEQYLQQNKNEVVQDTTSSEQQDAMIMSVIEEMSNQVAKCNAVNKENKTVNESLTAKLERYKEHVNFFEELQKFDFNDRE